MRKFPSALTILATAAAAAILAGCASTSPADSRTGALTPTEQWTSKVSVDARPDELLLAMHAEGLSPNQAGALQTFVQHWAESEGGPVTVRLPRSRDAAPGAGGDRMALEARDLLVAQGLPAHRVSIEPYDSTGQADAPLVVAFDQHVVNVPRCGEDMENLTRTMANGPSHNFGCAITANMAAQIANPADLLRPRDSTPVDAARRGVVFGKYREGQVTSSAKDEQAAGTVSKAVN